MDADEIFLSASIRKGGNAQTRKKTHTHKHTNALILTQTNYGNDIPPLAPTKK